VTAGASREHVLALYDEECPFCRASVALLLVWDRGRRLRPVSVQSPEATALLPDMSEEERIGSWHLVVPEECRWSAGAAAAPLLRLLPGGAPLAALTERFPRATQRGYEIVSGHRGLLGRLIPSTLRRRADAVIRRRS
jgi:predicted DCC family thiol-disulfide oxidoreductase YuxK